VRVDNFQVARIVGVARQPGPFFASLMAGWGLAFAPVARAGMQPAAPAPPIPARNSIPLRRDWRVDAAGT
jgi:hypothetical protein